MKKKNKRKKGASLIEVIVSITILAILIIPISNIVINAIKTNKLSERKQMASFEGQSVLEEFKSYDHITLDNDKFKLLSGDYMVKHPTIADRYVGDFIFPKGNDNYEVNVVMEKDAELMNQDFNQDYIISFSLLSNKNEITIKTANASQVKSFNGGKIIFEINQTVDTITLKEVDGTIIEICSGLTDLDTKKVKINAGENFIQPIDFVIENLSSGIDVSFDTIIDESANQRTRGAINTVQNTGGIITATKIIPLTGQKIGDLYNIKVVIKYKDQNYYTSSVAQNIEVKK